MTTSHNQPKPADDISALHHLLAYRAGHQPDILDVSFVQLQLDGPPHTATIVNTPHGTVELTNSRSPAILLEHLLHRYPVPVSINGVYIQQDNRQLSPRLMPISQRQPDVSTAKPGSPPTLRKLPYIVIQGLSYIHQITINRELAIINIPDYANEQPLYWPTIPHTMDLHIELSEQHLHQCSLRVQRDTPHATLQGLALQTYQQDALQQFDHALAHAHYSGDHSTYENQEFVSTWDCIIAIPKAHAQPITIYGDPEYYCPDQPYALRHLLPPNNPIGLTLHQAIIGQPDNHLLPLMLPINRAIRYPNYICEGITFTLADHHTIHVSQQHFDHPPAASIPTAPSTAHSITLHVLITAPDGSSRRTTIPAQFALLGSPYQETIVFTHALQTDAETLQAILRRVYRDTEPADRSEIEADQFDQREEQRLHNLAIQSTQGPHQAYRASLIEHWQTYRPYQPMPAGFDLPAELANLSHHTPTSTT